MAEPSSQRLYRAPCPGCGAPVEFHSAQSIYAVCSFCRSTVVRKGETLTRVGNMAELFEDHSPLRLQATGVWQGNAFNLVGRLQYRGQTGPWTGWIALFDDGSEAVLAEDNGAYVFLRLAAIERDLPRAARFRVGGTTAIEGKPFEVTSNQQVALISAQGELPKLPPLGRSFAMVELRSADGEVLSIDYGAQPPQLARGNSVRLEDLRLAGLREDSAKDEQGRHFNCPHCGAAVEVALAASRSVACRSCSSVIDMSGGIGSELRHAQQEEALVPLIPLGAVGQLQGARWQVVGYQHRIGHEPGQEDERFGWDEYLLYNRQRGFIFLVDSEEGWSIVKATTGAPALSRGEQTATYLGTRYELKYGYEAETTYVAGEFYWPVERGQKSFNRDFAKGASLLSMERTPREVTWSSGHRVDSAVVAKAFKLEHKKQLLRRSDAGPTSGGSAGLSLGAFITIFAAVLVLLVAIKDCAGERGSGFSGGTPRSGGGSFHPVRADRGRGVLAELPRHRQVDTPQPVRREGGTGAIERGMGAALLCSPQVG